MCRLVTVLETQAEIHALESLEWITKVVTSENPQVRLDRHSLSAFLIS